MKELRFATSFLALILAACFALSALSCGASQGQGQLQSITLSPATADAQQQFTATGFYVHPNHAVTPFSATWTACNQGSPTSDVTVSQSGTAKCTSNAQGAYSISASGFTGPSGTAGCPAMNPCGTSGGCTVIGKAQLTCP